jgi:hypothetical protein
MLTKADIEFIKRNRAEIDMNRTNSVIIYHKREAYEDPFTGDIVYEEAPETVEAVWTRYTSESTGTDDRKYVNGVVAETGDVFANFPITVDLSDVETVKHVASDELWRIRGVDKIGLGEPNRHYVLLGRVI